MYEEGERSDTQTDIDMPPSVFCYVIFCATLGLCQQAGHHQMCPLSCIPRTMSQNELSILHKIPCFGHFVIVTRKQNKTNLTNALPFVKCYLYARHFMPTQPLQWPYYSLYTNPARCTPTPGPWPM